MSMCANCGEKGHWAETCKKPRRTKEQRLAEEKRSKDSGGTKTSLYFENGTDEGYVNYLSFEGNETQT
eukprot:2530297-Pyramimonas_sp.AAC.1